MRVVAGRYRGRRLAGPRGSQTRPTSDKIREALFSILGDVEDARVLDLYAGTGALGIEALSRGARHATFVERHRPTAELVRRNLAAAAGRDAGDLGSVAACDAIAYLASAARVGDLFDLVLIDPPYRTAESIAAGLAASLAPVLADRARVVAECDRRTPLMLESDRPGALQGEPHNRLILVTERRYGDTLLRILETSKDTV
ncbi:MAG: 16S rRNA (guanine(966)-N(2))-methyltransferase RsmD [Solirubrobacterales bacterium]